MNRMYIHTMEYWSVLKRKEILRQAPTWVNLQDIVLSEFSQGKTLHGFTYARRLEESKS
jgi:hypothetical protein